jgi:hypothetical protein
MNVLTNQIIHMNLNDNLPPNDNVDEHLNYRWVNRDPNEITSLIETVKNDYQSDIILSLFTNIANKMYLVDHREDSFKIEVDLLGSKKKITGSSLNSGTPNREKYTITFNKPQSNFTCNCKDFVYRAKSHDIVCKHITFIICKVLGIYDHTFFETKKLNLFYQKRMARVIGGSGIWYNNEISVKHLNSEFKKNTVKKLNIEDTCPICCDTFGSNETISCPSCHQFVHKSCIDVWIETSNTCVYCRSEIFKNYKDIENL